MLLRFRKGVSNGVINDSVQKVSAKNCSHCDWWTKVQCLIPASLTIEHMIGTNTCVYRYFGKCKSSKTSLKQTSLKTKESI